MRSVCDIDGCEAYVIARGLCNKHYKRALVSGDPMPPRPTRRARIPAIERFWASIKGEPSAEACWLWSGSVNSSGYSSFYYEGKKWYAHRWAYHEFIASIPEGLVLDHLCRTPRCVNPWHLDPVTHGVNTLRGESPGVRVARDNICSRGHDMSNAYVRPDTGARMCRPCIYERDARYRRARKQKRVRGSS